MHIIYSIIIRIMSALHADEKTLNSYQFVKYAH